MPSTVPFPDFQYGFRPLGEPLNPQYGNDWLSGLSRFSRADLWGDRAVGPEIRPSARGKTPQVDDEDLRIANDPMAATLIRAQEGNNMMPPSPMGMIGQPQQMLAQGVGAGTPAGAGPTIPPQMMPPGGGGVGMGGMNMQAAMQDPRIMAYIRALTGGGGGGLSGAM